MTKGSNKRRFSLIGSAGDAKCQRTGESTKRKCSSFGGNAGAIRTPNRGHGTPARISSGKAVISKTPSGKHTPRPATSGCEKGGEQHGQVFANAKAKKHQKFSTSQWEPGKLQSAFTTNILCESDKHPAPRVGHDSAASGITGGASLKRDDQHAPPKKSADKKQRGQPSKHEESVVDDESSQMMPQPKEPPQSSAFILASALTPAHEQDLKPPLGLSKSQLKKWKKRHRLPFVQQQANEAEASSALPPGIDGRPSTSATPSRPQLDTAVESNEDAERDMQLPEPPEGLNEHQRKLWIDRVRRVTLEILTPDTAAQPQSRHDAHVHPPEVSKKVNKVHFPTPAASSQQSGRPLVKAQGPDLWQKAITTSLIAAKEKHWVQYQADPANQSTEMHRKLLPEGHGLSAPARPKASPSKPVMAISSAFKNLEDENDADESADEEGASLKSDSEKSDAEEADQDEQASDIVDLAKGKIDAEMVAPSGSLAAPYSRGTAVAMHVGDSVDSQEDEDEPSSSNSGIEELEDADEDDEVPADSAHEVTDDENEITAQTGASQANECLPRNGGQGPSSSPVSFKDGNADGPSMVNDIASDKAAESDADFPKEEVYPSSATIMTHTQRSQSTLRPLIDDPEGLGSGMPKDRPRIMFSTRSFRLGNAIDALGYSVKPGLRGARSPKTKQVDARDAFKRFSSFVEGSDSDESYGSDSDDESGKSLDGKKRQHAAAATNGSQTVAQNMSLSHSIPDGQREHGLQVASDATRSAGESKFRGIAHHLRASSGEPVDAATSRGSAVLTSDEDEIEDDIQEKNAVAPLGGKLSGSFASTSLARAAEAPAADADDDPEALADIDTDKGSSSDDELSEDADESSADNEDEDGDTSTPQETEVETPPTPQVDGHRGSTHVHRPSDRKTAAHERDQGRGPGSAKTDDVDPADDQSGPAGESGSSNHDADATELGRETSHVAEAAKSAKPTMVNGNDAARGVSPDAEPAAHAASFQTIASWSFEGLEGAETIAKAHDACDDLKAASQRDAKSRDKPADECANGNEAFDLVDAALAADGGADDVGLHAHVAASDDEDNENRHEDEGYADSDEEEAAEESEQMEQERSEIHDDQPFSADREQSLYTSASQLVWQRITHRQVEAQILGEMVAANQSKEAEKVDQSENHPTKYVTQYTLDDAADQDIEVRDDGVDILDAQDGNADLSLSDSKPLSGFTAVKTGNRDLSKTQPPSTGKLKRPSAFLDRGSGVRGPGRARAQMRSGQPVASSPSHKNTTSFTFGDNDDGELDQSISEIQKDVFESITTLPFGIDPVDKTGSDLPGESAVNSGKHSQESVKSRRQLSKVAIPPVQPADYNNVLACSVEVPESSMAPVLDPSQAEQAKDDLEPEERITASDSEQPAQMSIGRETRREIRPGTKQAGEVPKLAPRDANDSYENLVECYACVSDGRRCLKSVSSGPEFRCRSCVSNKQNCLTYEEGLGKARMRQAKLDAKPTNQHKNQSQDQPKHERRKQSKEEPKTRPQGTCKQKSKGKAPHLMTDEDDGGTVWTVAGVTDRCYSCASRGCNCYRPRPEDEDQRCRSCVSRKRPCRTFQEGCEIAKKRKAAKHQKELSVLHLDHFDTGMGEGQPEPPKEDVQSEAGAACKKHIDTGKNMPPPANPRKRKTTGMTSKHFSPDKRSRRDQPAAYGGASVDHDAFTVHSEDVSAAAREEAGSEQITMPRGTSTPKKNPRKSTGARSPFFLPLHLLDRVDMPTPSEGRLPAGVSRAPIPPIVSERFGIIQEKLWKEPFWLIIAVTFLNKTAGRAAAPTFWKLKERYETPEALAEADQDELHDMIQHLGLQNQRARRLLAISKAWIEEPPAAGKRHKTLNYPVHGDHMEHKAHSKGTSIEGDVKYCKGALEIAHIPGCGPYAWDSWRIFCRDVLRGVAEDYNGKGAVDESFEPEWQRVLPLDKELVATLRWMWLREGWIWDPKTGKKRRATDEEMERAEKGEMEVADMQEGKFAAQAAGVDKCL